eukprot:3766790-Rhodomonas_salina.2
MGLHGQLYHKPVDSILLLAGTSGSCTGAAGGDKTWGALGYPGTIYGSHTPRTMGPIYGSRTPALRGIPSKGLYDEEPVGYLGTNLHTTNTPRGPGVTGLPGYPGYPGTRGTTRIAALADESLISAAQSQSQAPRLVP